MKKLLSTLLIAPLVITACGTEEADRDTHYGKDDDYITIGKGASASGSDTVTLNKDTFYQLAKDYGSSIVKSWMNSEIAKWESENLDTSEDSQSYAVKNGLAYYNMFQIDGAYDHDSAIDMFTSEILWEEFQTHSIVNGSDNNTSFAISVWKKGVANITMDNITEFNRVLGGATDRATFLSAAEAHLAPYYEYVRLEAGERLMTVNWLLSQETVTKISGSTYYKPSSRLEDIYSDNTPTEWTNFTFDAEKIADVTAAINFDFGTGTIADMESAFTAATTGDAVADYSINGMGTKNSAFNAPTEVTNVAHSSNDEYRKLGWVNTGTEDEPKYIHSTGDDEFTIFHANPIELEDYHYASGDEGPDGPADESDLKGLLKPDDVDDAADLQDARRLYSYFKLSQISDVQTFAVNYYYSEWDLKAFDEALHDAIGSDLDN